MDISELNIIFINLYNFDRYPFIKYCMESNLKVSKGAKIHIVTEDNLRKECMTTSHLEWALNNKYYHFASDEIRLQMLLKFDHALYIDMDGMLTAPLIQSILDNPEQPIIDKWKEVDGLYISSNFIYVPHKQNPAISKLLYSYAGCNPEDYNLIDVDFIKKYCPREFDNFNEFYGIMDHHSKLRNFVENNPDMKCIYIIKDVNSIEKVVNSNCIGSMKDIWLLIDRPFWAKPYKGVNIRGIRSCFLQIAALDVFYQLKRTVPLIFLD